MARLSREGRQDRTDLAAVGLPRWIGLAHATLRVLAFALKVDLAGLAAWPNSARTSLGKVSKVAVNSVR
jgi:hypothetical protein